MFPTWSVSIYNILVYLNEDMNVNGMIHTVSSIVLDCMDGLS